MVKKRILVPITLGAAFMALQPFVVLRVDGASMAPTFHDGQLLLARRVSGPLRRGDVVVFRHDGERMVKRVAFVPGDAFPLIRLHDEWLFPSNDRMLRSARKQRMAVRDYVVPPGSVYVIGDNTLSSRDSRDFGAVPVSDLEFQVPSPPTHVATGIPGVRLGRGAGVVAVTR